MERKLTPTQKAWIKDGYEHAKGIHNSLEEELNRNVSYEELQEDSAIKETGEIIYGCAEFPERSCFDSDEDYNNADYDLEQEECWELFNEGVQKYVDELKSNEYLICSSHESDEVTTNDKDYYVNVDGEDIKVNVKNDSEYSCLLNCLEGYYIYGIGREDEEDTEED